MKKLLQDYFTFNKRERNGIVVLLLIIASLLIYRYVADRPSTIPKTDFSKFEQAIEQFETSKAMTEPPSTHTDSTIEKIENSVDYFYFNPNNFPAADWERLGLSEKQIRVIKNYEGKGGKFYSKADVKKMYCIPEHQYLQLEPYILISDERAKPTTATSQYKVIDSPSHKNNKSKIIEINTADTTQLLSLKGIGSFYAKQIIKRREQLGGYYSKQQLLEVWKFDEEKLKTIEAEISIDLSFIRKININTCTAKELKHPYLSWTQANGIINYRNKHGNYRSIDEIKNTDLIDEKTFENISPYLTLH